MKSSTGIPAPELTYAALVGRVVGHYRGHARIKQSEIAHVLGITQSAYSKLESGDSIFNAVQIRLAAGRIGMMPAQLFEAIDHYESDLSSQGVAILATTQESSAGVAVGLGILAAILLSSVS